jgi:zinc transport system substrate-binding protein
LVAGLLLGAGPLPAADDTAGRLTVFASVLPIRTFVEQVGGERVDARVMVLPGQSPATYDPSPRQVAALAEAALYLRVGVPFEDAWMRRIRAANPEMVVVDLRQGLPLRPLEEHDHDHDHGDHDHDHDSGPGDADGSGEAMDPHVWTSPVLARAMTAVIRDQLTALDPAGGEVYRANRAAYAAELDGLDAELRAMLDALDNRRFMVYHPAWGYFAETYDLTQIPIEREGKEPGPRRLTGLIEQARAFDIRLILVQAQFDERAARQVAKSIGGRVETVDPLAPDYVATLRRLGRLIAAANSVQAASARSD